MRFTVGIDIGSTSTEAALYDAEKNSILATSGIPTGGYPRKAGLSVYLDVLQKVDLDESAIHSTVSTGYGRTTLEFVDKKITEITCHARGARFVRPNVRTVIDIGGQDSKVISLDETGHVRDFVMNDRCAAGTGRFLEVISRVLEIPLEKMGEESLKSQNPVIINSTCAVFAESEVIGLLTQGVKREDILSGVNLAISNRILAMAGRIVPRADVVFCGGVARNQGMRKALEEALQLPVVVPDSPEMIGSIGAALMAAEMHTSKRANESK